MDLTLENYLTIALAINAFILLVLVILSLSNRAKIKRLMEKYEAFMKGADGESIEGQIERYFLKVDEVESTNADIKNSLNIMARNLQHCIQKVGIVRYNAFDNVGSDLSYSIALLDNNDDGIVLSGLFTRDSSLTYAKPVFNGKSKYALSAEEIQALEIAKKSYREKLYY